MLCSGEAMNDVWLEEILPRWELQWIKGDDEE
jgi:hypothetical protein